MTRMFEDTTPEMEELLVKLLRDAPTERKLEMMNELSATARTLALAGLRDRHPDADDDELHRRLADLILGKEKAAEVFGPLPPEWEPTYIGEGPLDNDW